MPGAGATVGFIAAGEFARDDRPGELALGEVVGVPTRPGSERELSEMVERTAPANPNFDPKTALDPEGRFQQDVFSRLRRERDETPIVLAE